MTSTTLNALKEVITHWRRLATGKTQRYEGIGPGNCALCHLFNNAAFSCVGCPVQQKTGRTGCADTPYRTAEVAYFDYGRNSKKFRAAARAELEFLKKLLPKKRIHK
jgi:hypothetical protein